MGLSPGTDDRGEMGVCVELPEYVIGLRSFEHRVYRTQPEEGQPDRAAASRRSSSSGGGADEAPEVYKRLPEVLAAHGDTVRVKHRLRPLGVAMAGRDVRDPYKD